MIPKNKIAFSGKLNHIKPTIFSHMSALATEHGAINLAQGFPDFAVDPALIERVHQKMLAGQNQYAPMAGHPALREKICALSRQDYGAEYQPEREITITAGATQAIATALAATIREGDEVLLFSPAYDCYLPMIELHGGTPITVKLLHPEYRIDWQQVKRVVNHRTKMIIINSPHNPSGTVWDEEDLDRLEEIVGNSNILVLADEVYEHIVFGGAQHRSVRSRPALRERSFVVGSLGKTLHVTGWKIGYCLAPEFLMREFQKVHQYLVFSVNHPVQEAIAEYLETQDLSAIGAFYGQKQALFEKLVREHTRLKPLPSKGSYFQLLDYSAVSEEGDLAFAERLTREIGVASIPLSPFYRDPTDHKVLRFCFAKDESTLGAAVEKLASL